MIYIIFIKYLLSNCIFFQKILRKYNIKHFYYIWMKNANYTIKKRSIKVLKNLIKIKSKLFNILTKNFSPLN